MEEVLRRVIPIEGDPPAAYETVGHIAHLNLRYVIDINQLNGYYFHAPVFLANFCCFWLLVVLINWIDTSHLPSTHTTASVRY